VQLVLAFGAKPYNQAIISGVFVYMMKVIAHRAIIDTAITAEIVSSTWIVRFSYKVFSH